MSIESDYFSNSPSAVKEEFSVFWKYKEESEISQLKIRELLKNLDISIVVLDEASGIAEHYFPDGTCLVEENFIDRLSEEKKNLIHNAIADLYKNGSSTIVAPDKSGDRIIRTTISFASDGLPGFRKILAINSDISQEIKYQELENRSDELLQLQKFAQGIAHDFGNIAQTMDGFVNLLSREIQSEKGALLLENLRISANRAMSISRKISEISRIQVLKNYEFHLLKIFEENLEIMEGVVSEHVNLELRIQDDLNDLVFGNPEQIERIIINIIENANHAIGGKGNIDVNCYEDSDEEMVIIEISNDGPAIAKHIANKMFLPFITTKKEGGTGLGLFLAYEYLNSCGGYISLQNRNHDVSFKISLPRISRSGDSDDN